MSNENALAAVSSTAAVTWTPEQVDTITRTVAKGATKDELSMFMHLSKQYGLDPFAKDIWFIKMGSSQPVIMTSRDGYLKIANRDSDFDGLVSDVVYANDKFSKTKDGVNHEYSVKDRGPIAGAYAMVYRKSRSFPVFVFAPMRDYAKPNGTWKQYPHAMILKVAEAMALKRAFSISGLVTKEELEGDVRFEREKQQRREPRNTAETKAQLYQGFLEVCDGQKEHAKNAMLKVTEGRGSGQWTDDDIMALGADLMRRRREKREAAEKVIDAEMWDGEGKAFTNPDQSTAETEEEADIPEGFGELPEEEGAA